MKKQMSYKKFRLFVLSLDLLYFGGLIFLFLFPKTSGFMAKIFQGDNQLYAYVWGIPILIIFVLNWQMFDERVKAEKRNGTFKKNKKRREKCNKNIFVIFNILSIFNIFFIVFFIQALIKGTTIPFSDFLGIFSFIILVTSISFWISKLILRK